MRREGGLATAHQGLDSVVYGSINTDTVVV